MPIDCVRASSGGKGNVGMFIDRNPRVCAAGTVSAQPCENVSDSLKYYLLKDKVDALISDTIKPDPKPRLLPPLRHPPKRDMRNAGPFGQVTELMIPPIKSKFQTLVEDLKCTSYGSYWKPIGKFRDPIPYLPAGFDIYGTTLGKAPPTERYSLYDIVMPKNPLPDRTPKNKQAGTQIDRNYIRPGYNPNKVFGKRVNLDQRGIYMKCCLTDDKVFNGTALKMPLGAIQADFQDKKKARLGVALTPNNNINSVPAGYSFGVLKPPDNLPECLTTCEINPGRDFFKKCLGHLNSVRQFLKKRYEGSFFKHVYLYLRYYDKSKSGWLPKEIVYELCGNKLIRFNPDLIEPLLTLWKAFDGKEIEYNTLLLAINFTQPSPQLPRIWDIPDNCIDFRTSYSEMAKPGQEVDKRHMAGLPSGRYFDKDYPVTPNDCCKAFTTYLPQESDMKSCLFQSILTILGVSHRDMFEKRDKATVRKVFEAAGEKFSDDNFEEIWNAAKNYHSKGFVCYETFRRAMREARGA